MQDTQIQILSGYSDQNRILFAGETAGFLIPWGKASLWQQKAGTAPLRQDPEAVLSEYINRTKSLENYMQRQWGLTRSLAAMFQEMVSCGMIHIRQCRD